jgi:hypothetical protein
MKLRDYILNNNNGRNIEFALDNNMTAQQVGQMVKKGTYYVYDGMLVIARKTLAEVVAPKVPVAAPKAQGDAKNQLDLLGE